MRYIAFSDSFNFSRN